jgi:cytidyltransferase-like protein
MKEKTIVLATGGFDPLHSGHVSYLKQCKELGAYLIVGVNSDAWLTRKKGRPFMSVHERCAVVSALSFVDEAWAFEDSWDLDGSARFFIQRVLSEEPAPHIVFANGGDRTSDNIPEMDIKSNRLHFMFGVGGDDKKNSSSWILEEWKSPKTERPWGYYRVLHEDEGIKVKELTINPGCAISMQKHSMRNEHWHIVSGIATVEYQRSPAWKTILSKVLQKHDTIDIEKETWHRVHNESTEPLKIVEIQYGKECVESDIERDNQRFSSNANTPTQPILDEFGEPQGC